MTSCMTLKTVTMVTRMKLLFVAYIHTNAYTYNVQLTQLLMQNPILYDFHGLVLFI